MLARLASRATNVVTKSPVALSVRNDSHYHPSVNGALTQDEVLSRMQKDIETRDHERFRWQRMNMPFTQTYVVADNGFEYCRGGIPGWLWMLIGTVTLSATSYKFIKDRFHDPYIFQQNPGPDLEEYHRIKDRLASEPDFWNWDERDAAKTE
ncbi:uncharacterized protein LOC135806901 [Sycon ciliatum]|uniref:uncharacterized protein LOC135806901 n=1 Tax=Sycon ciliatum TaxID=27933 RepID=UPI0020ACCBA8|eukprot:scpid96217/ scgid8218/ 